MRITRKELFYWVVFISLLVLLTITTLIVIDAIESLYHNDWCGGNCTVFP